MKLFSRAMGVVFMKIMGFLVAPPGFEPGSRDLKSRMLGRYTTGLLPNDRVYT